MNCKANTLWQILYVFPLCDTMASPERNPLPSRPFQVSTSRCLAQRAKLRHTSQDLSLLSKMVSAICKLNLNLGTSRSTKVFVVFQKTCCDSTAARWASHSKTGCSTGRTRPTCRCSRTGCPGSRASSHLRSAASAVKTPITLILPRMTFQHCCHSSLVAFFRRSNRRQRSQSRRW